jgi:hypothetical protein
MTSSSRPVGPAPTSTNTEEPLKAARAKECSARLEGQHWTCETCDSEWPWDRWTKNCLGKGCTMSKGGGITERSATCIASNLNMLDCAIQEKDWRLAANVASVLRANLYAHYYDVLPIIEGQKTWPQIGWGSTWDLNGVPMPYPNSAVDPKFKTTAAPLPQAEAKP